MGHSKRICKDAKGLLTILGILEGSFAVSLFFFPIQLDPPGLDLKDLFLEVLRNPSKSFKSCKTLLKDSSVQTEVEMKDPEGSSGILRCLTRWFKIFRWDS